MRNFGEKQGVQFYRDKDLPFFELKECNTSELSYKKHAHDEYSIGIVDQGSSCFWYAGKMDEISPRSMVFLPPNLIHSCNPINRDLWGYKMLFINPDWVKGFTSSQGDCSFHVPIVQDISTYETLQLVNTMMDRLISQASPLEKEASLLAVFEQALSGEEKKCYQSSLQERPKLKMIQDYLQSRFLEKITLAQLEQASGLNKFHIIRLFKEAFNIPPHTYQILLRINYAKKELGRYRQLADIAIAAGFYDQSHFSKVFKSYTGITPEGYQKFIR